MQPRNEGRPAGTGRQVGPLGKATPPFYQYDKRHGTRLHLPRDWRNRLPAPADYYAAHVAKLGKPNRTGWAQGRCPFHEDKEASLSVNLQHGGWRCFAGCGKGDLVNFHERPTALPFKRAVRALLGLRHE